MIHKKYMGLLLAVCMLFSAGMLSSCGTQPAAEEEQQEPSTTQEDIDARVESKLDAYKTDLLDSATSMESNSDIRDYLIHWAKTKSIDSEHDKYGNVMMKIPASEGYEQANPTVLLCPYDAAQYNEYVNPAALSLYLVKNHENTGPLTLIFTPEKKNNPVGIQKLSAEWFTDDTDVIVLNAAEKGLISLRSGAASTYAFTSPKYTKTKPELTIAYRISVSGLQEGHPDSNLEEHQNPILYLNSILASLKNKNIAYEISAFNGGTGSRLYASSADLVITLDADKEGAFIEYMDKTVESFTEKNAAKYPEAKLEYIRTAVPETVIPSDEARQIVSFLYTLLHGIYAEGDDGSPVSFVNVSRIRTTDHHVVIDSCASALDELQLREIDTGEETLCSLSNFKYKKTGSIPAWNGADLQDPAFSESFAQAYLGSSSKPLNYLDSVSVTPASYAAEKNPSCSMICITLNENILPRCTSAIVRYLLDSTGIEPEQEDGN